MPAAIIPTNVSMSRKTSDGNYGSIEFTCEVQIQYETPDPSSADKADAVNRAFLTCAKIIERQQTQRGIDDPLVSVTESVQGKRVVDRGGE